MNELASKEEEPALYVHEWLAVAFLSALLVVLAGIALFSGESAMPRLSTPHYVVDPEIDVFVEGEVQNPGRYRIKRGTLVKEVLAMAVPLPEANIEVLKLDKKVRKNQTIKVKSKKSKRKRKKGVD